MPRQNRGFSIKMIRGATCSPRLPMDTCFDISAARVNPRGRSSVRNWNDINYYRNTKWENNKTHHTFVNLISMKSLQNVKYAKHLIHSRFSCKPEVNQTPSQAKSEQNAKDIHQFCKKVSKIVHTFANLRFGAKKVSEIVNTFKKVILKVKKTDGFLKVTCRKCDRGVEKVTSETPNQSHNNKRSRSGTNHSVETKWALLKSMR